MRASRRTFASIIFLASLRGTLAQDASAPTIPSGTFIVSGLPPPPPPPPDFSLAFDNQSPSPPAVGPPAAASSPPTASPPATAPSATTASNAGASHSQGTGSSSLSGGAIAGIVIGAIAGVALIALVAFFLLRRRRYSRQPSLPGKMETGALGQKEGGDSIPQMPSDLHASLAPLHSGYGLSWKEGDEVSSLDKKDSIKTTPMSSNLESSLADVPFTSPAGAGRSTLKDSNSFMQVMSDNVQVIVKRGPGGSLKISKTPGSNVNGSNMSNVTDNSQAVSIQSGTSGESGSRVSGSFGLPELPWSDWEIKADDIIMSKDERGESVKLGSGAYGTVYKATIDGVTEVAVKIFHDVHSQMQQADILREVAILKSCRDRNIVQFLGACIMDERIMLVTELMEAGDLWHALVQYRESGALSWYRRGKRIAIEVARGLHFLHRHKIIHFDLKSANVLLTREGTAKISDVGFANILSNTHLSNNAAAFTFAWAAPEVLMGAACTDKVDIFSYGVLLWEIVTGQQPRRGQLRECKVPEECPAEVESLIQQCLSFDPEQRPNCKQIVEVLVRLQDDSGPPATRSEGIVPPASLPAQ